MLPPPPTGIGLILLISAFLSKKSVFFAKNSSFSQNNSLRAVSKIFLALFSGFVRYKVTDYENVSFTDYTSEIQLLDCSKLAINRKNYNNVTICLYGVIVKFF